MNSRLPANLIPLAAALTAALAAATALAAGNKTPGSISGREMEQAIINGTKDLDNQAAGTEFKDIAKFVKENAQLLSPQAKATFAIYEKYAKAAQAKVNPPPCDIPKAPTRLLSTSGIPITMRASWAQSRNICLNRSFSGLPASAS